eukprot:2346306-Amphidinium_carterae.1
MKISSHYNETTTVISDSIVGNSIQKIDWLTNVNRYVQEFAEQNPIPIEGQVSPQIETTLFSFIYATVGGMIHDIAHAPAGLDIVLLQAIYRHVLILCFRPCQHLLWMCRKLPCHLLQHHLLQKMYL